MIAVFAAVVLSQTPSAPPVVTVTPDVPGGAVGAPAEAMSPLPGEGSEVKAFAQFVDRHLLAFEPDSWQGSLHLRQRERVLTVRDDDFTDAFRLVPEAASLAQKAKDNFAISVVLQTIGLSVAGVGLGLVLVATLFSSAFLPLLLTSLVADLVGLAVVLISVPFQATAMTQFTSAVATYNRGLLDLRPPSQALSVPGAPEGGLVLVLP
jgi:hypothetical protein